MPSALADTLYSHLLDRFPADRDYPRGALYVDGMPPLVAGLLGRTLDRWLEHELDKLESRWFDFEDPGVRAARTELVVALGRTARVPRGAWAETLRYAVGAVVRHLVTPADAITDATFEGESEPLPPAIVRARLRTFEAYPYLPDIAELYLEQKKPQAVDPETFHDLLVRIDRKVTADYSAEQWVRLLGPLFKLARRVPDTRGISPELLGQFFEAKGRDDIVRRLREHQGKAVNEEQLHALLARSLPEGSHPVSPAASDEEVLTQALTDDGDGDADAEATTQMYSRTADEDEETEERGDTEVEAASGPEATTSEEPDDRAASVTPVAVEPEPLWKRYAVGSTVGPTIETSIPDDRSGEEPDGAGESSTEPPEDAPPVWKRFFSGRRQPGNEGAAPERTEPPGEEATNDTERHVLGAIDERQRHRFIRDLFDGNEEAYRHTLENIRASGSWSAAARVIATDVFKRYGVDIYSERAIAFTDAIQEQFEARETS